MRELGTICINELNAPALILMVRQGEFHLNFRLYYQDLPLLLLGELLAL